MAIWRTSAIADFDQVQFDALDRKAGLASSHGRLRQKEQDARWLTRYLGWSADGVLKAAIPVCRPRALSWPDEAYDPRSWNLPGGIGDECSAEGSLLVAGCADRRTGFHVSPQARKPDRLRSLLAEAARLAADEDRCLAFPYLYTEARNALAAATDDRIIWTRLNREAHLFGLADAGWESSLPSKVRNTLRRDRRKIAAAPMTVQEARWDEIRSSAAELIAVHNVSLGVDDRPEFVNFRYADWLRNPDAGLMAFTAQTAGLQGVQTILLWEDELEVHEVGLDGEDSDERFAMYVNLLFHLPIQYARARGIDHLRLGVKAETPKASRGAVFEDLHGGVLSLADTKRLACD